MCRWIRSRCTGSSWIRLEDVERWDRPYLFRQDLETLVRDLPIGIREGRHEFSTTDGAHFLFRSFCHFRMIPRGNVFSQSRPLPVSQGTEVWAWDGYLNWADDNVPPLPHFSRHTNRRSDFYPTMNQARYTVETTRKCYLAEGQPGDADALFLGIPVQRGPG